MADLTGTTPAATYKGLLQINDYTDGIAGNTDSNALAIQDGAGNATALAVSTDNVGIGTTNPEQLLHLKGQSPRIRLQDDSPVTDGIWDVNNNNSVFTLQYREGDGTNPVNHFHVLSNGNVGIGTTSPDYKLDVKEASNSTYAAKIFNGGGDSYGLLVKTNSGTGEAFPILDLENTAGNVFRVQANGNVGIGTTSPYELLTLGTADSGTSVISFMTDSNTRVSEIKVVDIGAGDGELSFWTRKTGASYQRMTIDSDGNVGIGTTSFGATAAGVLAIKNGTAPTSSPADMVQLYAKDDAGSSRLYVRNEAGTETVLSPHAADAPSSLYDRPPGVEEMHRSANYYLGTIVFTNVDRRNSLMQKQLNGEELPVDRTFTVTETFAEYNTRTGADLQVEDWDANQQAMFDEQEEKVVARQAEIDAWDNEEEEAPAPLESYVKKPKPEWLS